MAASQFFTLVIIVQQAERQGSTAWLWNTFYSLPFWCLILRRRKGGLLSLCCVNGGVLVVCFTLGVVHFSLLFTAVFSGFSGLRSVECMDNVGCVRVTDHRESSACVYCVSWHWTFVELECLSSHHCAIVDLALSFQVPKVVPSISETKSDRLCHTPGGHCGVRQDPSMNLLFLEILCIKSCQKAISACSSP
jgi:hypothetical protein